MPKQDPPCTVDVTFGRNSEHPVMYVLPIEKPFQTPQGGNIIVTISDQKQHVSRRLTGCGWRMDPVTGETNSGWLFHATMRAYPKPAKGAHAYGSPPSTPREIDVAVKWVRGREAIETLRREAKFYDGPLRPLQGLVVPTFYGLFTTVRDGVNIGCMVLEWCPGNDPAKAGKPSEEVLRMRANSVERLHRVGVYHGSLYESIDSLCMSDGRHFLRAAEGTIRIVDFQRSHLHRCTGVLHNHYIGGTDMTNAYPNSKPIQEACVELVFALEHSKNCPQGSQGLLKKVPWNAF